MSFALHLFTRGVEFFTYRKRGEREGVALGTFVLLFIFMKIKPRCPHNIGDKSRFLF